MKTDHYLLLGALTFLAASLSFAQPSGGSGGPPPGGGRGGGQPDPVFGLFDTNHDGAINANEIAAAPDVLRSLDQNGDGILTPDELRLAPPPRGGGRSGGPNGGGTASSSSSTPPGGAGGPPPGGGRGGRGGPPGSQAANELLRLFDTNHDGVIDASEIAAASDVLRSLDQSGSGELTPNDFRQSPPPPGPRQGGGNAASTDSSTDDGSGGPGGGPPGGGPGGQGGPPPGGGRGGRGGG